MPERRPNVAIISVIVVVLLAGATVATIKLTEKSNTKDNSSQSGVESNTNDTPGTATESNSTANGMYKDGTYTETGSYTTPGGPESITITITLAKGVITATSAQGSGGNGNTIEYQGKFIGGYKDEVVGKKIDDVSLSRVSGSSLTSKGFNSAIDAIKKDAQSS